MRRPREPSFSNPKKTKNPNPSPIGNRFGFSCLVGAGGFEPPKLKSSRFTVCPHWPLGNTPRFCSRPLPDDLFILSDCGRFVNYFFRIFAAFLRKLSAGSVLGQMFPALVIPQGGDASPDMGYRAMRLNMVISRCPRRPGPTPRYRPPGRPPSA